MTRCFTIAVVVLNLAVSASWSQCQMEEFLASDGASEDEMGRSVSSFADWIVVGAERGDGCPACASADCCDSGSVYVFNLVIGGPGREFVRGDANADGSFDISDPVYVLSALFDGGPPASCADASDANDDGSIDISDAVYCLSGLFVPPSPLPPLPHPDCGEDPTSDGLDCAEYDPCP